MICVIDENVSLKEAYKLQIRSYQVEAERIQFMDLPPLKESFKQFKRMDEIKVGYYQDDILCGFIAYEIQGNGIEIQKVAVDPICFHQGIAKKLLAYIEQIYPNMSTFIVHAAEKNVAARNLYESCGYITMGQKEYPGITMMQLRKEK